MTNVVGIIAEDVSDVEVIRILLEKLASKKFYVSQMVGHGCGKIRSHCAQWAALLKGKGCNRLILVHDSDNNSPEDIEKALERALGVSPISPHILVVPTREIEAWLLADEDAINVVLSLEPALKAIGNTESIADPKAHLRQLVRSRAKRLKEYFPTTHNVKVAQKVTVGKLKKCKSFAPLAEFAAKYL